MKQEQKYVRLIDLNTKQVTTIPAAELAPAMIEAKIQGMEGSYWIDLTQGRPPQGPFVHDPFEGPQREEIQQIMHRLAEVYPLTYKQWEDGFRRDLHAESEILTWTGLTETFIEVAERHNLDLDRKKDLFGVLATCLRTSFDHVWQIMGDYSLPKEIVREVVEQYYGQPTLKEEFKKIRPEDYADMLGGAPMPITELEKVEGREFLKHADIIIGVDCSTREGAFFFGEDRMQEFRSGSDTVRLAVILYDARTDHLEYLGAIVRVLKGSCCYPR